MKTRIYDIIRILPHDIIGFVAAVLVIVGMYSSRAMMSIGMIVMIANAMINAQVFSHFKVFFKKTHLVLLSLYYVLMFISIIWTSDYVYFMGRMQVLLPFLVLPFAFFSLSRWEYRWYDLLMILFVLLNLGGISWSMYQYLQEKELFDIGYGYSKLIPTPFKNDHIRFSLSVVMSILFCLDILSRSTHKTIRWFLYSVIIIDVLYIHILAAKTGVIALYLIFFLYSLYQLASIKYKKTGIMILLLLSLMPFIMYRILPSFKNKVSYVIYSIEQMKNVQKQNHISDEGRLLSYAYALDIIKKYPFVGVGVGDVYDEMKIRYEKDFKEKEVKVLLPHNQFLMAGASVGIIGIVLMIAMLVSVFKTVKKNDFLYFSFLMIMLFAMMVEPLFETQYGSCIFLFFLLLLMKRSRYYLA